LIHKLVNGVTKVTKDVIRVKKETYFKLLDLKADLMKKRQDDVSMDDVIQELLKKAHPKEAGA